MKWICWFMQLNLKKHTHTQEAFLLERTMFLFGNLLACNVCGWDRCRKKQKPKSSWTLGYSKTCLFALFSNVWAMGYQFEMFSYRCFNYKGLITKHVCEFWPNFNLPSRIIRKKFWLNQKWGEIRWLLLYIHQID